MKKLFLAGFILLSFFATAQIITAPDQAAAFTCFDNSVHPNPPPSLGDEDRRAVYESTCEGRGGFRSVSDTVVTPTAGCDANRFFLGFPRWYQYLQYDTYTHPTTGEVSCRVIINSLADTWLIVAAVLDILLRIAALVAVGFIVVGGVSYVTSQGEPDKTKHALQTIINALIGLVLAIVATGLVTFIAGRFK